MCISCIGRIIVPLEEFLDQILVYTLPFLFFLIDHSFSGSFQQFADAPVCKGYRFSVAEIKAVFTFRIVLIVNCKDSLHDFIRSFGIVLKGFRCIFTEFDYRVIVKEHFV